eukprot:Phypoly_transcript_19599.p1 GENE.Phypoly_transcript_19599~~Phypoly_transcript_19599.p1  ORF type:complete len:169 (+),score=39.47 Phypoly_transcript_19599:112-618(+)
MQSVTHITPIRVSAQSPPPSPNISHHQITSPTSPHSPNILSSPPPITSTLPTPDCSTLSPLPHPIIPTPAPSLPTTPVFFFSPNIPSGPSSSATPFAPLPPAIQSSSPSNLPPQYPPIMAIYHTTSTGRLGCLLCKNTYANLKNLTDHLIKNTLLDYKVLILKFVQQP